MDANERLVEAWKTTVAVQMHFNEMEMRIRNVAITVLAAFLAAAGFTTKENLQLEIFGTRISLTTFVLAAAAICWLSFYLVDRHWYHRLLRGAVDHGLSIEKSVEATAPELGLTTAIGKASPLVIGGKKFWRINIPKLVTLHSGTRLGVFYWSIFGLLIAATALTLVDKRDIGHSATVSQAPPTGVQVQVQPTIPAEAKVVTAKGK